MAMIGAGGLWLHGCASTCDTQSDTELRADDVTLLRSYLRGAFSSEAQSREDPETYFDIRIHCVPIWEDRTDGPWMYNEQSVANRKPYRQRVYRLSDSLDGFVSSAVYTLPGDPQRFAGAWRDPRVFDSLSPDELDLREGCTVLLKREGFAFVGGTVGNGCTSTFEDAAYVTSEMTLLPDVLLTWDRGWTAEGEHAFGPTEGGYVFDRVPMPE